MKLLCDSAIPENDDSWVHKIPIIGWTIAYKKQIDIESSLVQQVANRGPVADSCWECFTFNSNIKNRLEEIVIEHAYPVGSTFHPDDPFELMIVLRYGDLNEVEIMMQIEEEFNINFDDTFCKWLVDEQVTFYNFIKYIENHSSSPQT